jgi:hypothetical protein
MPNVSGIHGDPWHNEFLGADLAALEGIWEFNATVGDL